MTRSRDVINVTARSVPCNGCTACCEGGELIVLHPEHGDQPSEYLTIEVKHPFFGSPAVALRQKPDGSCVYLERGKGCTIHERRPAICREFDCRRMAQKAGNRHDCRKMVKSGLISHSVLQAGFDRMHTL